MPFSSCSKMPTAGSFESEKFTDQRPATDVPGAPKKRSSGAKRGASPARARNGRRTSMSFMPRRVQMPSSTLSERIGRATMRESY